MGEGKRRTTGTGCDKGEVDGDFERRWSDLPDEGTSWAASALPPSRPPLLPRLIIKAVDR